MVSRESEMRKIILKLVAQLADRTRMIEIMLNDFTDAGKDTV